MSSRHATQYGKPKLRTRTATSAAAGAANSTGPATPCIRHWARWPLDPPALGTDDLTAAWADLEASAHARDRHRRTRPRGRCSRNRRRPRKTYSDAATALAAAESAQSDAQSTHTAAVRDAATADLAQTTLTDHLSELDTLLGQAPPEDGLPALFEECTRLEKAVETATADAGRTRETAKQATAEQEQWQKHTTSAPIRVDSHP